jgi:prenyltransferase beta subunit
MDHARLEKMVEEALRESAASLTGQPWMNQDGGIGRDPTKDSDIWSTAEALILACRLDRMNVVTSSAVERMKKYVIAAQRPDGGWADADERDAVGTTLALMALRNWPAEVAVLAAATKGVAWLAGNQNSDGGWDVTISDRGAGGNTTAFPTIHAYEALTVWFLDNVGPIASVQQALNNARVWLSNARQPGGQIRESAKSFAPTVRHTAYAMLADRSVGGLDLPGSAVVHWLEQKQHRDGTWSDAGSTEVETTATAVRAMMLLGAPPQSKRVESAIESLLERRIEKVIGGQRFSGWPTQPEGLPSSWPTYYALLALIDYLDALRNHSGKRTTVPFPVWRQAASLALFLILVAGILTTIVIAGERREFAAALTTLVAVADIVAAIPLLAKWSNPFR